MILLELKIHKKRDLKSIKIKKIYLKPLNNNLKNESYFLSHSLKL